MDVRVYEKEVLSSDEETPLKGVVYEPDGDPKGLFQVVHGMTEHIARYDKFKSENDPRSWLTKDVSVRRAFDADEYCNFKFTLAAMKDLVTLNRIANSKSFYNELAKDTRVLMLSGKDDPVGNYGKGVTEVYNKIRRKGINVNMKLYENCRHEILNDDSYDDVVKDILEFIKVRR